MQLAQIVAALPYIDCPRFTRSERHMDPRRELDLRLGRACESLIAAVMRDAVEPLLGFLTAATAAQVRAGVWEAQLGQAAS